MKCSTKSEVRNRNSLLKVAWGKVAAEFESQFVILSLLGDFSTSIISSGVPLPYCQVLTWHRGVQVACAFFP